MNRGKEMRLSGLSVERLRWFLLAGVLLLVAALVVLLSYGRYRAVQAWKQVVKRSGATITHEADGVTYSQSLRGKTIFVLHAKHEVPHGGGRYTLEDGMLELYGPDGKPADRISGAQFDYDEKNGVAKALGEVDMELQLPKALSPRRAVSPAAANEADKESQVVHVRTSGLTYVKKLGVAATDQEVEIEYGGMHGWSKGAEFDTGQSVVHLLADVRAQAQLHGAAATLNATKADLDRSADVIELTAPRVESRGRVSTAATAVLHLRKDGSLETVDARGAVTVKQGTRTIAAPSLSAAMNEDSRMRHAELSGGVALEDTSAVRPMKGSATTVTIGCDGEGNPKSVVAEGGATLKTEQPRPGEAPLGRQVGADRVTLTLAKAGRGETRVSAVHAEGNAWATGEAAVRGRDGKPGGLKATRIAGDDLRLALVRDAAGKDEPQSLSGAGHTRLEQRTADGTVQTSGGDALEARFEPARSGTGVEIASAEQTGHVEIRNVPGKADKQPSEGVAERASLDGASGVLTLTSRQASSYPSKQVCRGPQCSPGTLGGHPRFTSGDTSVSAETIRLMQQTGDAVAEGDVAATLVNANAKPGAPVTHALAQQATLRKAAQTVEFTGTDAQPARMWQGASQVEAANLLLDRTHDSMEAWPAASTGVVRAVFANVSAPKPGESARNAAAKRQNGQLQLKGDNVVRVTSARMHYSGMTHEAVFTGGVLAQAEDGQVRSQTGVAFLTPKQGTGVSEQGSSSAGHPVSSDPVASSLDRVVMSGSVKVQQPGRVGTGEQLLYTAATEEFVLTGTPGHPPHVVDDKQGNITGATLLFRSPDSTIVVDGVAPGLPGSHRVHTETTIRK